VGQAGDVLEAGLYGGVAGDVTPAVERLRQHDVVDHGGIDPGAAHGFGHGPGAQLQGIDVDEGALERRADRSARRGHDDCVRHRHLPLPCSGHARAPRRCEA
jgi:hypothetical protein